MYNHITIDWFTFSLKPDQLAENKRDVDLDFIYDLLNLNSQRLSFENIGGRNGYPICWQLNGVSIMCPAPDRYEQMGYCVSMTGRGLEWYNSLFKNFDIYEYLRKLRALTETGISLNISRFDIALDDKPADGKSGILNLDVIIQKAENGEYISTSRTKNTIREIIQYKGDNITGRTIYFGSRKSTSYIRIYDKAAEQGVAGHWIRVEFEFKQETAMRIVNAMCLVGEGFPEYFSEVANHYLRFIELDDTNRSRCSLSSFWSDFLGTFKKSSLTTGKHKSQNISKLFSYILHAFAPSLYTIAQVFPAEFITDMIWRNGIGRLKKKHYDMIDNPDVFEAPYSNSEKWDNEIPMSIFGQLAIS